MPSLGFGLGGALGGDFGGVSDEWPARMRALVYEQFKNSNWAIPLANAIGVHRGQLQLVFEAVMLLWSIDPVTADDDFGNPAYGVGRGVQLDRIGKLVNQARGGASDAEYRPILRARIRANKSNGTPDDVINVFLAMFAGEGSPEFTPGWVAQFTLRLVGVIMDPLVVTAAVGLLTSSTQAGTRAVLEWSTVDDSEMLICDSTVAGQSVGDADDPTVGGALAGAAST